jgi:hypothetical protein
MKGHHAKEILVYEAIVSKMKSENEQLSLNNRKMRAIIRVPRLHGQFQGLPKGPRENKFHSF